MDKLNEPVYLIGTNAERLALAASEIDHIVYFTETDVSTLGDEYAVINGTWVQTKAAGAALTTQVSSTGVAQTINPDGSSDVNIAGSGPATAPHIVNVLAVDETISTAHVPAGFSITYATVVATVNEAAVAAMTLNAAEVKSIDGVTAIILFDADSPSFAISATGSGGAVPSSLTDGQQFQRITLNTPTPVPLTAAMVKGINETGRVDMRSSSSTIPLDITVTLS